MRNNYLVNVVLGFLLMINISACESGQSWVGNYSFAAEFGQSVPGNPLIVNYELTITDSRCALSVIGYQVADELLCDAKKDQKGKLNVLFKSYADGSLSGFYPVQLYQVGELLFSLSEDSSGLITEWGSLIVDNPYAKKGEYFKKQQ